MARKLRLEYAGACYHVINRGNYRRALFAQEGAAKSFEICLGEAATRFQWLIHAYVVMRNHFHLAIETPEPNLGEGMRWLQVTWAVRFNRYRGEAGHPFQGRFKAQHVEPGHALAQVAHYVHLNPVRAGLVPVEHLASFEPGSLHRFGAVPRPRWLTATTVLHEAGGLPDTSAGWRRYIEYLGALSGLTTAHELVPSAHFTQGWMIGSPAFTATLSARLDREAGADQRFALYGVDRTAVQQARSELWEKRLQLLAAACDLPLDALPGRKSDARKLKVAAAMKTLTSVSNRWLADRLNMGGPASVSSLVSAFRRQGQHQTAEFQTLLSHFAI